MGIGFFCLSTWFFTSSLRSLPTPFETLICHHYCFSVWVLFVPRHLLPVIVNVTPQKLGPELAKKTIISLQWLISSWDLPAVNHGCYCIYFLNTTSVILCRRVSKRKFAIGWSECTSIKTNGRTLLDQNYSKQRISWRMNDFFIEKWIFTKLLQWNRSK